MKTLDQTVRDGIKVLERSAEKRIRAEIKNETLRMWKERKVISVSKWEKIEQDRDKVLNYLPDDFIEHSIFYFNTGDEEFEKEKAKWFIDYFAYLESKKNFGYGRKRCSNCILNPYSEIRSTSIRDVILKFTIKSENPFPCDVVNIFKCPYEQGKKDYALLDLGYIWKIIHDALYYAYSRTTSDNSRIIYADFEKNRAFDHFSWSPLQFSTGPLAQEIGDLRLTKVSIKYIKDIYAVLTDREKLELVLEQYIESVADNYGYVGKRNEKSEQKANSIRAMKNSVMNFFMNIKDKIKLEDLRDLYDKTLEDEEKEKQRLVKHREWIAKWHLGKNEEEDKIIRSGICLYCEDFANIHCNNCDIWVCDEHWKEHGISKHNMKLEEHSI